MCTYCNFLNLFKKKKEIRKKRKRTEVLKKQLETKKLLNTAPLGDVENRGFI